MATLDEQMARMAEVAALERLAEQGGAAVPRLVARLADADPVPAQTALRLLFGLAPVAALPARFAEGELLPAPESADAAAPKLPAWLADNLWNDPEAFCRLCVETAARLDAPGRLRFTERLAPLAGIREELSAAFAKAGFAIEAEALNRAATELARRQYPAQITFAPTMRCNLRCPYCIAGAGGEEAEASSETAAALLDWMARHGVRRLGLSGGEPTLYGRFPELLADLRGRNIEYYLATNGLMPQAALAAIQNYRPLCLTLHLTPEVMAGPLADAFRAAARRLAEAHVPMILRCNFAEPDTDVTPYLDFAREHGIRELRVAIPMPNSGRGNAFVDARGLAAFAPLLARLVAGAEARAMQARIAKPYPLCLMPEAAARHFLENGSFACACPNFALDFSNNLIVYPDLRFAACLGLNRRSPVPVTQYEGPRDAARLFAPDIARRIRLPLLPECAACPLGRRGRCVGACLSYR